MTFKILSKDEFKGKLTKYLKDQEEENGRDFNEQIKSRPSELSELFYHQPGNWWTEDKRKELIDILTGVEENQEDTAQLKIEREPEENIKVINFLDKNSEANLYQAIPELTAFFERIHSSHFIKGLDGHRINGRANILEIFAEKHKSLETKQQIATQQLEIAENPEKFEETVQNAWKTFKEKMREHFSHEEYVYFFAYTKIKTIQNKNKSYTINVQLPASEEEISKRTQSQIYSIKKLDGEILPLLNKAIKQESSTTKKYRNRVYSPSNPSLYEKRKSEIGSKNYTKFLQHEKGTLIQGELFTDETNETTQELPPKSTTMFYEYEGNKAAHGLLSQWLQSQRNTKGPCSPGVILQGEYSEKDQRLLIEYYIEKIKEELPFLKVGVIDCEHFSIKCQKLFRGEDTAEPVKKKWERVDKWVKSILPANVFVLYNIEKLENRLYSQQQLLQAIGGKAKILATSNKRISEFSEAKALEGGTTEKKGFRADLLNKIKSIPRSVVNRPQDKECGSLLYNMVKRQHPSVDLPRNLIVGIGKLIQDTSCYDALIEEILSACEGGTKPFDFNKAKEVIQNRIDVIYNPTLDEIYNTVHKFFENMDEKYSRSRAQINTMKKKYTAYLAKKIPLPGTTKIYRTYEDIASYIKVTPTTVRSYISEITDTAIYKKGIEDKINELRDAKEKIILGII